MTTHGNPASQLAEEYAPMSEIVKQSSDGWRITYRDVVDYRQAPLPPLIVGRATGVIAARGGEHVLEVDGEKRALGRIVVAIGAARDTVVVGAFLVSSPELVEALLAAAARGVRVYLLVASEQRLLKEPRGDSDFDQRMFEAHKRLLDRMAGWVLVRTAADWHAKVVLTDDAGYLLTANLTAEALSRNEELVVALTQHERAQLRELLRWVLWGAAEHEVLEQGKLRHVEPIAGVARPVVDGALVATLQERGSLHAAMLEVVASARHELIVSSYGWDTAHPVVEALCARARDGVRVTVLARARAASMPALLALAKAGATVRIFRWLHAKAIWSDGGRAIVATANLEPQGLDRGIELGVLLHGDRAAELHGVLAAWAQRAASELRIDARLGDLQGKVSWWRGGKLEEVDILATYEPPPETMNALSADRLDAPPLAAVNTMALPRPLAHTHAIQRVVAAPVLDTRAKPVDGDGSGPRPLLFREPRGRLVVAVKSVDQLEAARTLANEKGAAAIVVEPGAP